MKTKMSLKKKRRRKTPSSAALKTLHHKETAHSAVSLYTFWLVHKKRNEPLLNNRYMTALMQDPKHEARNDTLTPRYRSFVSAATCFLSAANSSSRVPSN